MLIFLVAASASAGEHSTADALGSLAQTLDVHRVLHVDTHLHNEKLGDGRCYLSDIGLQWRLVYKDRPTFSGSVRRGNERDLRTDVRRRQK
jgi:hypothetical protein